MKIVRFVLLIASVVRVNAFQTQPVSNKASARATDPTSRSASGLAYTDHVDTEYLTRASDSVRKAVTVRDVQRSSGQVSVPSPSGVNTELVQNILTAQGLSLVGVSLATSMILMLSGHSLGVDALQWNSLGPFISTADFGMEERVLVGLISVIPLTYFDSVFYESSDRRDVSLVQFSTTHAVMSLLGRCRNGSTEEGSHSHPRLEPRTLMAEALMFSTAIALMSGLSEEVVFRAVVPSGISFFSHSSLVTLVVQALVFGHLHLTPQASREENRMMCATQTMLGGWFGLTYLLSGGDIVPCIVAHSVLTLATTMKTWVGTNAQMDYTEKAVLEEPSPADAAGIRKLQKEAGPALTTGAIAAASRFFYAFDSQHRGNLSEADVQRAISFAFLQDKMQPTQERVNKLFWKILQKRDGPSQAEEGRMGLSDFLRLLFLLKAKPSRT